MSQVTVSDNCVPSPSIIQSPDPGNFLSGVGPPTTVTFTAIDASLNSSQCSFTVQTIDSTPPNVSCPDPVEIAGCSTNELGNGNGSIFGFSTTTQLINSSNFGQIPIATNDHCGIHTISYQDAAAGNCSIVVTRTYTVSDESMNTSQCSRTITIVDNTFPTASDPVPLVITCGEDIPAPDPEIVTNEMDNCNAAIEVSHVVDTDNGASGCPNYPFIITREYRVADCNGNGNAISVFQTITVVDDEAPTWTTNQNALDVTLECDDLTGLNNAQAMFPVATDNCDSDVANIIKSSGSFSPSQICPQAGNYTNTWTVTDDCGNVAETFTQLITIIDTQAPTWTTNQNALDVTLECDDLTGINDAQAMFPVATDNCDLDVANIIKSSGSFSPSQICLQAGSYTNTWTVTDDCGNVAETFTQTITIIDTQAPTWTTNQNALDVTLECDDLTGLNNAQAMFPVATDNCDLDVANIIKSSGSFSPSQICLQAGSYTNTWTVTDDCGNVAETFTQTITIIDTQAPTWTTNQNALDVTLECDDLTGLNNAQAMFPVATDNCDLDGANIIKSSGSFSPSQICLQAGNYTNTWMVTDDCGNVAETFTQTITIIDTQAPTWTTNQNALDVTLECDDLTGFNNAQAMFPVATDNCDSDVANIIKSSGSFSPSQICLQAGSYTNTWTVTDDCGNVAETFTQTITIIDTQAPTWTTNQNALDVTLECDDLTGLNNAQAMFPIATDNCDLDVANIIKSSGSFSPSQIVRRQEAIPTPGW